VIDWWWLLVEAAVFVAFGVWSRGATRAVALHIGATDPVAACRELNRRGYDMEWKLRQLREDP
jgi:hypothetical protein